VFCIIIICFDIKLFITAPIRNIDKCVIDDEGFLLYDDLIYVPENIRTRILEIHHDSVTAGHFGVNKTSDLIYRNF